MTYTEDQIIIKAAVQCCKCNGVIKNINIPKHELKHYKKCNCKQLGIEVKE